MESLVSDARKILDERLAKGEITEAEHEKLLARIDVQKVSSEKEKSDGHAKSELPKGSVWQGVAGLVLAVVIYNYSSNAASDIIMDCVNDGRGSFNFCKENAVKWPFVYAGYGLAGFLALTGIVNLFLSSNKRNS
jgi:hypothetical protein